MKQILLTALLLSIGVSLSAQSMSKGAFKKQIKKHRQAYKEDFLKDERSPFHGKEEALDDIKFFKPNLDYRCDCQFNITPNAQPFLMATYSGATRNYVQYGRLYCMVKGQEISLAVYRNLALIRMPQYKNHLFIPFKDLTNGDKTYGGGRYIDIETTDIKENQVSIDFNKCYNPWCAFSDGYNCPIPPVDNHLTIEILAGEKNYKK